MRMLGFWAAVVCWALLSGSQIAVAGDFLIVPGLSLPGFAALIALMLVGSVVALVHRTGIRGS